MKNSGQKQARLEELKSNYKLVEDKHKTYRQSGFGLMTTIITLSAGSIAAIEKSGSPRLFSSIMFAPIACGVLQQLAHYLGEMMTARAGFVYVAANYQKELGTSPDNLKQKIENAEALQASSNRWFKRADDCCVVTVAVFLLASILILVCLE